MKVIAVYNIKGGVGKTATAVNLGYLAARDGARTLIWDLDPQAATTYYLRVKPKVKGGGKGLFKEKSSFNSVIKGTDFAGYDVLPGDFSYRKLDRLLAGAKNPRKLFARILGALGKNYDFIFFDCAPGMTTVAETLFQTVDTLLVPTVPTTLCLRTLQQLRKYLLKVGATEVQVLPFFSMVDRRKSLHREIGLEESFDSFHFLKSSIPYQSLVEQMGIYRAPVVAFAPRCKASESFEELWKELLFHLS